MSEIVPTWGSGLARAPREIFLERKRLLRSSEITRYVKNGLILHLDGILNTRKGHDKSSKIWEDLSGNFYDWYFGRGNPAFDANSLYLNGSSDIRNSHDVADIFGETKINGYTIEICFKRNTTNDFVLFHSGQPSNIRKCFGFEGYWHGQAYEGGPVGFNNTEKLSIALVYSDDFTRRFNGSFSSGRSGNSWNYEGGEAIIGSRNAYGMNGNIYSFRVYNRTLTTSEMINNYQVDIARFGLFR